MSSTQRYLQPLALSAMRGLAGNTFITSCSSRDGFGWTMRGVGTIGGGEGKEQGPERTRGRGRGRSRGRGRGRGRERERALEIAGDRGRDRSNSQQPGGIRDGESSRRGSDSGSRGGTGGRGAAGPRKSRGRGQGAFMSFLEPHRRKTDIESRGGDGRTGRKKFEREERERERGEYDGGHDKRGSGGAARNQEFDDGDAYDEFDDDSFRVPRHLAVPRKVMTLDGEFDPWSRIGDNECEQEDIDSRTWEEKVAEAWKRSSDKDDPDWDESDEDFHKMSYHYATNPIQKATVNGPRGKYKLPSRRARSVVDLLQEFDMPEKLDIKPGDSEYETLKDAWVVVSHNPSMSRRSKNRLIKQMARFLHKHRESTELADEMELPTLEELRRRENMTYRDKW